VAGSCGRTVDGWKSCAFLCTDPCSTREGDGKRSQRCLDDRTRGILKGRGQFTRQRREKGRSNPSRQRAGQPESLHRGTELRKQGESAGGRVVTHENAKECWAWWLTLVIPDMQEAEVGGS
jgi:hypothetical protein